jgi:hypothetical protein
VSWLRERTVYVFALLLTIALCVRLYTRGGPYFERPRTVFQHVGPEHHEEDDVILACQRAAPLIPRNATVTCFHAAAGVPRPGNDFMTAVGFLPRQRVLPPGAGGVQYAISLGAETYANPAYAEIATWPEGRLYKLR